MIDNLPTKNKRCETDSFFCFHLLGNTLHRSQQMHSNSATCRAGTSGVESVSCAIGEPVQSRSKVEMCPNPKIPSLGRSRTVPPCSGPLCPSARGLTTPTSASLKAGFRWKLLSHYKDMSSKRLESSSCKWRSPAPQPQSIQSLPSYPPWLSVTLSVQPFPRGGKQSRVGTIHQASNKHLLGIASNPRLGWPCSSAAQNPPKGIESETQHTRK